MKTLFSRSVALLLGFGMFFAVNARADATVTVCGKDVWPGDPRTDLSEALAIGGRVNFACSGTIVFSRNYPLLKDVALDGGGNVTLDGNGRGMFQIGTVPGVTLSLRAIALKGGGSWLPGGVVSGEGTVLVLDGTTISNCRLPIWIVSGQLVIQNAQFSDNAGAVVTVLEGTLDISRTSSFANNSGRVIATGPATHTRIDQARFLRNGGANFGGAVGNGCDVSITKSSFSSNFAAVNGGAFSSRCKLNIEETEFDSNRAGMDGGAIFLGTGSDATMRATVFSDNQAVRNGGAIANIADFGKAVGPLRLRSGRFERNQAGATGGAISTGESGPIQIGGVSFVSNSATNAGGALYVRQSPLQVSRSLFLKNRSGSTGGAIESYCMPPSSLVANSIIAGNVAARAAAFYGTNMLFINTTIASNGGRPVQQGRRCAEPASAISFANTIIEGGFSGGCTAGDSTQTFRDLGHNLQFPGKSCGPAMRSLPPLLGIAFAPFRPFSPAGSAGDTNVCHAPPIDGRDIFGAHRPQGSACSIGAVEGDLSAAYDRAAKGRQPRRGTSNLDKK